MQLFFVDARLVMLCPHTTQIGSHMRRLYVENFRTCSSCRCSRGVVAMSHPLQQDVSACVIHCTFCFLLRTPASASQNIGVLHKQRGALQVREPPFSPGALPKAGHHRSLQKQTHISRHSSSRFHLNLSLSRAEAARIALQLAGVRDLHAHRAQAPGDDVYDNAALRSCRKSRGSAEAYTGQHSEDSVTHSSDASEATKREADALPGWSYL